MSLRDSRGGSIVRVWSTDWWVNPGRTLERVHARLQELLEADRAQRAVAAAQEAEPAQVMDGSSGGMGLEGAAQSVDVAGMSHSGAGPEPAPAGRDLIDAQAAPRAPGAVAESSPETETRPSFQFSSPLEAVPEDSVSAERFYDAMADGYYRASTGPEGPGLGTRRNADCGGAGRMVKPE